MGDEHGLEGRTGAGPLQVELFVVPLDEALQRFALDLADGIPRTRAVRYPVVLQCPLMHTLLCTMQNKITTDQHCNVIIIIIINIYIIITADETRKREMRCPKQKHMTLKKEKRERESSVLCDLEKIVFLPWRPQQLEHSNLRLCC